MFVLYVFFNVDLNVFIKLCGRLFIKLIVLDNKNFLLFVRIIFLIEVLSVVNNMFFLNIFFFLEFLNIFISLFIIEDLLVFVYLIRVIFGRFDFFFIFF